MKTTFADEMKKQRLIVSTSATEKHRFFLSQKIRDSMFDLKERKQPTP